MFWVDAGPAVLEARVGWGPKREEMVGREVGVEGFNSSTEFPIRDLSIFCSPLGLSAKHRAWASAQETRNGSDASSPAAPPAPTILPLCPSIPLPLCEKLVLNLQRYFYSIFGW